MDGILNINKPRGRTSFSIVATVKSLSGEQRVGHAGTLDPAATGVLPVCLGQGTRVTEFLIDSTKVYWAEIQLGVATDTYDSTCKITQIGDHSGVSKKQLESALASYCGLIEQTPPMYSAVKYQGKPLYQMARAGINVEMKSRPTRIYSLQLTDWQPPIFTIEVVCGKGTYIRSLAHALGQSLGCGANLKNLIRQRCGPFDIKNTISLPQLEDAFNYGYWHHFVYPIDAILSHWSAIVVSEATRKVIRNGCPFSSENSISEVDHLEQHPLVLTPKENRCRVYAQDGCFLGVLRFNLERGQWEPEKVFCS